MFYPEASEERCTAALLAGRSTRSGSCGVGVASSSFALAEYVNDRPYVASSFLSVALVNVFKSAMAGVCKGHEELAGIGDPVGGVAAGRAGARRRGDGARRLFEPLGYEVDVDADRAR